MLAIGDASRVLLVGNMEQKTGNDLIVYQQCINACALKGVAPLRIIKDEACENVKFAFAGQALKLIARPWQIP